MCIRDSYKTRPQVRTLRQTFILRSNSRSHRSSRNRTFCWDCHRSWRPRSKRRSCGSRSLPFEKLLYCSRIWTNWWLFASFWWSPQRPRCTAFAPPSDRRRPLRICPARSPRSRLGSAAGFERMFVPQAFTPSLKLYYRHTCTLLGLSLIHIWRCRRYAVCRSRWSPYH